jgi:DNA-binding NtrC family response regulator
MGALTTGHDPSLGNGIARPVPLAPAPPATKSVVGFHGAVTEFKRRLIEATLAQAGGNRTRAAKALGLQRTYLLRLMREFQIRIPPQQMPPRRSERAPTDLPSQIH